MSYAAIMQKMKGSNTKNTSCDDGLEGLSRLIKPALERKLNQYNQRWDRTFSTGKYLKPYLFENSGQLKKLLICHMQNLLKYSLDWGTNSSP